MSGRGCAAEAGGCAGYRCSHNHSTEKHLLTKQDRTRSGSSSEESDGFVCTDYLLAFPSPSHFCLLILFLIIITDMRLKLSSKCLFS